MPLSLKNIGLLLFILLIGCNDDNIEVEVIPEDVIQKDPFSTIMVDILIIEGYRSKMIKPTDSLNTDLKAFYKDVFNKNNTTKEQYDRSYRYYSNHPSMMEEVYNLAEKKFKLKEDEVGAERKEKSKLIDKIQKSNESILDKK